MGVNDDCDDLLYSADIQNPVIRQVHIVEPVEVGQGECRSDTLTTSVPSNVEGGITSAQTFKMGKHSRSN